MDYPKNFVTLREEENRIYGNSILEITSNSPLSGHLRIFYESTNIIFDLAAQYKSRTEREEVMHYIGLRLFNSSITAFGLMLSGYYQVSFSIQRDILEIRYLLDYFTVFPKKIIEWKTSGNSDRYIKFGPALLRKELDRRDGLKCDKREKEYKRLCEYGAHVSYPGFRLLKKKLGPFLNEKLLKGCLEELTKQTVLATKIYIRHFGRLPKGFEEPLQEYDRLYQEWKDKYAHFAETTVVPPE